MKLFSVILLSIVFLTACQKTKEKTKVVVCVPVYGQSLGIGEDSELITDIDNMSERHDGRILSEGLGKRFGYYEDNGMKQWTKRLIRYYKRRFENSSFAMAEVLADSLGKDTAICIFAGGRGATAISNLMKGSEPYETFLDNIRSSCQAARKKGMEFIIPAICWMQGESDMFDYTKVEYKRLLKQFAQDIDKDVKAITGQQRQVMIVCYQSCCLPICWRYNPLDFECYEATVPQAQLDLIRYDSQFVAGTPVYPFSFVNQRIHLDGKSQQEVGKRNALAVLDILRNGMSTRGLYPTDVTTKDNVITVKYNNGRFPLLTDTVSMPKKSHFGFTVITRDGKDICNSVITTADSINIICSETVDGCKLRYAVNGTKGKAGKHTDHGGNIKTLRDGMSNWCYMFSQSL